MSMRFEVAQAFDLEGVLAGPWDARVARFDEVKAPFWGDGLYGVQLPLTDAVVQDAEVQLGVRLRQPSQQQRRVRTVILARKHEGAGLSESVDVEDFGTTYRFRAADDSYTVEPLVSILRRTRRRSACE
ncbi:hypothetical protein ABZV61_42105 [Streptomyces sp900116325]|uniref:Uncharacterized protein n=1 Tax=Streptomyces sp. 900116325 TaxID=3154295 RepID=A0ABV2UMR1_9ACTN